MGQGIRSEGPGSGSQEVFGRHWRGSSPNLSLEFFFELLRFLSVLLMTKEFVAYCRSLRVSRTRPSFSRSSQSRTAGRSTGSGISKGLGRIFASDLRFADGKELIHG